MPPNKSIRGHCCHTAPEAGGALKDEGSPGEDRIGAGRSGLSTGYYLQRFGFDFAILAADERVGDTWRDRWASMEPFTPAFYNGLPGLEFPADDPDQLGPGAELTVHDELGHLSLPAERDREILRSLHDR